MVALTAFSYKEIYGHFAGTEKSGCDNEGTIRRASTAVPINNVNPRIRAFLQISAPSEVVPLLSATI